jgi:hypothetical protein
LSKSDSWYLEHILETLKWIDNKTH